MPLTADEKSMARKLLKFLSKADRRKVVKIVTNKEDANKTEQIEAIINCSGSVEELLDRKKITKGILLDHLNEENVDMQAGATPQECVNAVIQHWRTPRTAPAQNPPEQDDDVPHSTALSIFFEGQLVNIPIPPAPAPALLNELQKEAEDFVDRFYNLLNASSNSVGNGVEKYGPQLFLPDCFMNIKKNEGDREHITGGEAVRIRLAIVRENGVCFTPKKDANSLECLEIAEGVMQIRTCGLVQDVREDMQDVGVFAQQFRVMKDAGLENKWRVKSTNIALMRGVLPQPITLALSRVLGLE